MRIRRSLLVLVLLTSGPISRSAAVDRATDPQASQVPDAASVLALARQALGGEKRLAGVKTLIATGRTQQVRGDNLVPIEFEIAIETPDKYVRKDEIPAQETGITSLGFNGEALIQVPPPAAPAPGATAAQAAGRGVNPDAARNARVVTLKQDLTRRLLGMFAGSLDVLPLTFTYVARAEAPQGKADVIEAKGPGNFSARLFVNSDTHLPVMVSWQSAGRGQPPSRGGPPAAPLVPAGGGAPVPAQPPAAGAAGPPSTARGDAQPPAGRGGPPGGPAAPVENRLYFADYRDVDGLQLPFRIRRAVGPDTIEETTFDRFRVNAKIDPKRFEVRK